MPVATPEDARDYMLDLFKLGWDAGSPSLNGGVIPTVEYQNIEEVNGISPLSTGNVPWVRVKIRHITASQRSFGPVGSRIFTKWGTITIQVFTPKGKQGLVLADRLGNVALSAIEGKTTITGDILFRDAVYREAGVDGSWFQGNITATFEYDTVK